MARTMFIVIGISLLVVGGGLYLTSAPISEDDAVQRAARTTRGADGQKMYTITSGEVSNALHQRQQGNSARAGKRQIGGVLAVSGIALVLVGIATGAASRKPETAEPAGPGDA